MELLYEIYCQIQYRLWAFKYLHLSFTSSKLKTTSHLPLLTAGTMAQFILKIHNRSTKVPQVILLAAQLLSNSIFYVFTLEIGMLESYCVEGEQGDMTYWHNDLGKTSVVFLLWTWRTNCSTVSAAKQVRILTAFTVLSAFLSQAIPFLGIFGQSTANSYSDFTQFVFAFSPSYVCAAKKQYIHLSGFQLCLISYVTHTEGERTSVRFLYA